ncbi:MAG: hypothetical protein ACK55I_43535, partial [bacterium]
MAAGENRLPRLTAPHNGDLTQLFGQLRHQSVGELVAVLRRTHIAILRRPLAELHIEKVHRRRTALQIEEDDRLGRTADLRPALRVDVVRPNRIGHFVAGDRKRSQLQEVAAA